MRRNRGSTYDDHVSNLKGRMAEAFVESIFRRAGYLVSRVGRESQLHRLIKVGSDEFLPDFLVRKRVKSEGSKRPLHRLVPIEVKYRRDVQAFLRRVGVGLFQELSESWPDLCFVFVTDQPDPGRSCFQVVDLWRRQAVESHDLHTIPDLEIFESTVREYEVLVKQVFALLEAGRVTYATLPQHHSLRGPAPAQ